MKFMVQFGYDSGSREDLLQQLRIGGLDESGLEIHGAWITVETGMGFALIETVNAVKLQRACSTWSDYGDVAVHAVVDSGN